MPRKNNVIAGGNYEKYIEQFFNENGYELATRKPKSEFREKDGDIYNIDNVLIECKFHKYPRMKRHMKQAENQAMELIEILKEEEDAKYLRAKEFQRQYNKEKKRKGETFDLEEQNKHIEKPKEIEPVMPVLFYRKRNNEEMNPNPKEKDYVIMYKEDWIKLFNEYQKKYNDIHLGEPNPIEIKKDN